MKDQQQPEQQERSGREVTAEQLSAFEARMEKRRQEEQAEELKQRQHRGGGQR